MYAISFLILWYKHQFMCTSYDLIANCTLMFVCVFCLFFNFIFWSLLSFSLFFQVVKFQQVISYEFVPSYYTIIKLYPWQSLTFDTYWMELHFKIWSQTFVLWENVRKVQKKKKIARDIQVLPFWAQFCLYFMWKVLHVFMLMTIPH